MRNQEQVTLDLIKASIQRSGRYSPWKNKCLIQSLAARWMLNKRKIPSQLSLGVNAGQNKKMIAHAWLVAGDYEVVSRQGDFVGLMIF